MRLWQLSLIVWGTLAATPFAVHAISTAGASSFMRAHCKITTDTTVRSACRDLGLD